MPRLVPPLISILLLKLLPLFTFNFLLFFMSRNTLLSFKLFNFQLLLSFINHLFDVVLGKDQVFLFLDIARLICHFQLFQIALFPLRLNLRRLAFLGFLLLGMIVRLHRPINDKHLILGGRMFQLLLLRSLV